MIDPKKIRKDLPLFIASGSMDPVGGCGKSITRLYEMYTNALGLVDVKFTLYPDYRHEILNEIGKEIVYADFLNFFDKNLNRE